MKNIVFIGILSLCISCGSTLKTQETTEQTTPQKTKDDILIGKQNKKALTNPPYAEWFTKNYEDYKINPEIKPMLKPLLENITIKAFMGTWCSDSQREVPTFYKILDASGFDYQNLELITVSREKTTPEGFEKGLDIKRVPTFIFYKDGKEVGRYVEFAVTTLEDDMLSILSGGEYKHSYYEDN